MKIWLKYLIGIAIGLLSAIIIPADSAQSLSVLDFIVDLVLRFGRYTLLPVLFFSVATSFFKLREEKLLVRTSLWTGAAILASTLILLLLGFISGLIIKLPRLPVMIEKAAEVTTLEIKPLLSKIFPYSGFEALINGAYLLPAFIFAGFAGAGATSDKTASKAAVTLFDSLSKVCYIVMSFFIEILAIGMVAIMSRWSINFITLAKAKTFLPLFALLFANMLLVAFVIYPLILRTLCHELHPYKVLYANLCSFLTAFFSGDTNLTLVLNMRHGKESLGIRRRINSFSFPLFAIFGRGGSALVSAVCFIYILRGYSTLGISVSDALWVFGMSFALSFILGELPVGGPFVAITTMCSLYGRGYEAGYLLLKDAAPIICCMAAGFDALSAMFGTYVVAVKTKMIEHKEIHRFI